MKKFIRFLSEKRMIKRSGKFLIILCVVAAALCINSDKVIGGREDFARLLKMMPSDGLPERYGNVPLRNRSTKKGMAPVVFPHWSHRTKYTCRVCHLELDFGMPRGESGITRGGNLAGRHCGACHNGKIAFSVRYDDKQCDRCHVDNFRKMDKSFKEFAAKLPKTKYGNRIDWVKALEKGLIKPKNSLHEEITPMELPEALKKDFRLGTSSSRSAVYFSHKKHVAWLDCSNCHPDIFNIKKKGTESFSMDKNLYGWFCGTCHLRVSFPMTDCNRCHPQMRSGVSVPSF